MFLYTFQLVTGSHLCSRYDILYRIIQNYYKILLGKIRSLLVCISPLSAIMTDQKEKFISLGLRVECVGKAQTDKTASRRVINGEVQLVNISPEDIYVILNIIKR